MNPLEAITAEVGRANIEAAESARRLQELICRAESEAAKNAAASDLRLLALVEQAQADGCTLTEIAEAAGVPDNRQAGNAWRARLKKRIEDRKANA